MMMNFRRALMLIAGSMLVLALGFGRVQAARPQQLPGASQAQQKASAAQVSMSAQREFLDRYCVACHSDTQWKLGRSPLSLQTIDVANPSANADVWERVVRKLRGGLMPPAGARRPDAAAYDRFAGWLETELDRVAVAQPNPGRTESFHRLNRIEYQNTIRDLLALEIDLTSLLPTDDVGTQGFDNIANALSVSPALLERYLSTARKLSRLATGVPPRVPVVDTYGVPILMNQDNQMSEDLPFGSRGGLAFRHYFPVDGEYSLKITLHKTYVDYARGLGWPHQLDVRLDGVRIKGFTVGGDRKGTPAPASFAGTLWGSREWEEYLTQADAGLQFRFHAAAGPRVMGVSFLGKLMEGEGVLHPLPGPFVQAVDETFMDGNPAVESVAVSGPHEVKGPGDTPSRRKIFVCRPADAVDEEPCAKRILTTLARRAYRRPVVERDVETLLGFYQAGRREGSFDVGIQFALERILSDPEFLFRVEADPPGTAPGDVYRLGDLALASRLSFFLWSSIPDDELLEVAAREQLSDPTVLEQQVRRMLSDARSKALVDSFAAQWLYLRALRDVTPDQGLFPDWDENLRQAFEQETKLFIDGQLRGDRSVVELLSANHTFVNERLARHYGIPNVYGNRFRKVTFESNDKRGGLLGQGSLLLVTSYPNRTSPVLRGKWLLANILGTPPPDPPPNVPGLKDKGADGKPQSVRERLEEHRKNPVCAACHAQMDPLGFALENYDPIGRWRDVNEASTPVDASAAFVDGSRFQGLAGLRAFLLGRREQFVGTVTEKLLAYALGRPVEPYDRPAVRKIIREAASRDYRWSSIIQGIAKSTPFQMRTSQSGASTAP